jgi:hypothetical protein
MSLFDNLPHTINLSHVTAQQGSLVSARLAKDATPYVEEEPAFVQPADATEITEFAARSLKVTHRVYINELPDGIRLSDMLDVTSGPYSGYSLKVMGWKEATAGVLDKWKIMGEVTREG